MAAILPSKKCACYSELVYKTTVFTGRHTSNGAQRSRKKIKNKNVQHLLARCLYSSGFSLRRIGVDNRDLRKTAGEQMRDT